MRDTRHIEFYKETRDKPPKFKFYGNVYDLLDGGMEYKKFEWVNEVLLRHEKVKKP